MEEILEENVIGRITEFSTVLQQDKRKHSRSKCNECNKIFASKFNMVRHYQQKHKKPYVDQPILRKKDCPIENCGESYFHETKLEFHLQQKHGVTYESEEKDFDTFDQFLIWKDEEERKCFVYFSQRSSAKVASVATSYMYKCQHDGSDRRHRKKSEQLSTERHRVNRKGRVRTNIVCPARMKARVDKITGKVKLHYVKFHSHEVTPKDLAHHPVSDKIRKEVISKLSTGLTVDQVFAIINQPGENEEISKRKFIGKHIVERIYKTNFSNLPQKVHAVATLSDKIQELQLQEYCPVFMYKPEGFPVKISAQINVDFLTEHNDLFMLAVQTKDQLNHFKKYASSIIFVDVTLNVTAQRLTVLTLKVVDEDYNIIPVTHLITNSRDDFVLEVFYKELQLISENVRISAVMTSLDFTEVKPLLHIYGNGVKHFVCKWHLHKDWCAKILDEGNSDIMQREIYFALVGLLEEKDSAVFVSQMNQFISNYIVSFPIFINYFIDEYRKTAGNWATCYKRDYSFSNCDFALYDDLFQKKLRANKKLGLNNNTVAELLELLCHAETQERLRRYLPEGTSILQEHMKGMEIPNEMVQEGHLHWNIASCAVAANIKVEWVSDTCQVDFCTGKCLEFCCFGLCHHLYKCGCKTKIKLCRHIHKIHSMRIGLHSFPYNLQQSNEIELGNCSNLISYEDARRSPMSEEKSIDIDNADEFLTSSSEEEIIDKESDSIVKKRLKKNLKKLNNCLLRGKLHRNKLDYVDKKLLEILNNV